MKKKKIKIKLPLKPRGRKTWEINPKTRVHDEEGYRRSMEKEKARKEMEHGLSGEDKNA